MLIGVELWTIDAQERHVAISLDASSEPMDATVTGHGLHGNDRLRVLVEPTTAAGAETPTPRVAAGAAADADGDVTITFPVGPRASAATVIAWVQKRSDTTEPGVADCAGGRPGWVAWDRLACLVYRPPATS